MRSRGTGTLEDRGYRGLPCDVRGELNLGRARPGGSTISDEFVSAAPGLADAQPASQQQSRTGARAVLDLVKRHRVWTLLAAAALIGLVVLAVGGYFFGWTWTGFAGNTVWDWLSLLITPVAIGAATIAFTIQQSQRGLAESERQRQFTLQIADIRQQENALEAYLDHISHLLIENDLKQSPPGSAVREAARAHAGYVAAGGSRPQGRHPAVPG